MKPWKLHVLELALLVFIGSLAIESAHRERAARAELKATLQAQQAQVHELQSQADARQRMLNDQLNALRKARSQIQTPQQAATAISEQAQLPESIEIPYEAPPTGSVGAGLVPAPGRPQGSPLQGAPSAPAELPAVDLQPMLDFMTRCKECDLKLQAAEDELKNRDHQLEILTHERDAAVRVVRGGTFWQRFKHDAKLVAITAGVGFIAGYVAHR